MNKAQLQFKPYHIIKDLSTFSVVCLLVPVVLVMWFLVINVEELQATENEIELGPSGIIEDLEKEIEEKTKLVEELQEKARSYNRSLEEQQGKRADLQNQIYLYNLRIAKLENDILLTEAGVGETGLTIRKLKFQIEVRGNELARGRTHLAETLRLIHENDQEDLLEIVLRNENLSDFFNQIEHTKVLQENLQANIDKIHIIREQLEKEKSNQEEQKRQLEELEIRLKDQKEILEGERNTKNTLLKETRNQEWRFQKLLEEVRQQQEETQKEIESLENKLRFTIDPSSIPEFKKGVLGWPSEGILTQGYGPTSETGFKNNVYSFHNGIDLAAGYGAPIYAAEGGIVVAMGDDGKYVYGKWLAIDHKNGLITMYGHLSFRKINIGQQVKRGEVIGYEGATGFSTGSHLHFTVYAAQTFRTEQRWYGLLPLGGSVNPMNYL